MGKQLGYNFIFTWGGKKIAGVTDDQLQITPNVKESITKDDEGATQSEIIGQGVEITVNGLCYKNAQNETTKLDEDDLIALNLKKGDSAKINFVYTRGSGRVYTGQAIPNGYSESSNSEDYANFSQNFKVIGNMVPQGSGSGSGQ